MLPIVPVKTPRPLLTLIAEAVPEEPLKVAVPPLTVTLPSTLPEKSDEPEVVTLPETPPVKEPRPPALTITVPASSTSAENVLAAVPCT